MDSGVIPDKNSEADFAASASLMEIPATAFPPRIEFIISGFEIIFEIFPIIPKGAEIARLPALTIPIMKN